MIGQINLDPLIIEIKKKKKKLICKKLI